MDMPRAISGGYPAAFVLIVILVEVPELAISIFFDHELVCPFPK